MILAFDDHEGGGTSDAPDPRRFETLMSDLTVDDAALRNELAKTTPPVREYVVIFTARSGSTWLTSTLSATNQLGHPEEYINPDFIRDVGKALNARTQDTLLDILKRRRKTENGVFGLEARAPDIKLFGEEKFFSAFGPDTLFINLWRENIVAQAISLYRAVTTGRFHSNDGKSEAREPVYDGEQIAKWLSHLVSDENANVEMLERQKRLFHNVRYEHIVRDRVATLKFFATALGVQETPWEQPAPAEVLQKIGDDWNRSAEIRFRSERAEFLAHIRAARKVRGLPQQELPA